MDQAEQDDWQGRLHDAPWVFASAIRDLHDSNPWPEQVWVLQDAVNTLMTELWDRGFSQTEIRAAFEDAVNDMPRYAAGEEVRR